MVDYHRMVWQYRVNRGAEIVTLACFWFMIPEVVAVFNYHFRSWGVIALAITCVVWLFASFVDRYTRIYRVDIQ